MKLVFIAMMSLAFSIQALACSCAEWGGAKEMLRSSDTAILAVPLEDSRFYKNGEYVPLVKTYMRIVKRYKGKFKKNAFIITEKGDGGNCGIDFKKHEGLFLIFGYMGPDGYYYTGSCDTGMVLPKTFTEDPSSTWEDPVRKIMNELDK